jgi:hypothetical protein
LYDKEQLVRVSELTCLWYGSAELLVIRYSWRWSIEQAFLESRHLLGVGQARNRTSAAVSRTLPLGLIAYSLVIVWYARHGHTTTDVVAEHRRRAPWYRTKAQP